MSTAARIRSIHSSTPVLARAIPSKSHLHRPIPDASFPKGYLLTGLFAGVKQNKASTTLEGGPVDLALISSTTPRTSAAGCFTRNVFKAAPVVVSTEVLKSSGGRANKVIVNSGCANAVTGTQGMENAWSMARSTDSALGDAKQDHTLVMSTGVIGQHLPIPSVLDGISRAASVFSTYKNASESYSSGFADWEKAAKAFMTTDTFPKLRAREFRLPHPSSSEPIIVRIAGIDKGAGMIHPNMGPPHATLLGLILTDAPISPPSLQSAVNFAVQRSFNCISVDGDMSTNDTILALANGAAVESSAEEIDEHKHPEAFAVFKEELTDFAKELAQLVVRDGEGATKFVSVRVKGAQNYDAAHRIASSVSTSSLVKCALYGEDANWGRILCAVGYAPLSTTTTTSPVSSIQIDPTKVSVSFTPSDGSKPLALLVNGEPQSIDEARAKEIVSAEEIGILIDLAGGSEEATYWTCDLSHEYVTINGDYRS